MPDQINVNIDENDTHVHVDVQEDITQVEVKVVQGHQYYDADARAAISLTTTGTGAATYDQETGVLNVPTPGSSIEETIVFEVVEPTSFIQLPEGVIKVKVFSPQRVWPNNLLSQPLPDGYIYDPETFRINFAGERWPPEIFIIDMYF